MTDRVLPHHLEAERSVLGAILVDNAALFKIADRLQPQHFFRQAHAVIYATMLSMAAKNLPIEFVSVKDALGAVALDECGGPAYIASLADGIPRATNVEYYARVVIDRWRPTRSHLRSQCRENRRIRRRRRTCGRRQYRHPKRSGLVLQTLRGPRRRNALRVGAVDARAVPGP